MNRIWITVIVCAIPSSLLGQCSLNGRDPFFPLDILASAIGQKGFGGVAFTLRVSCQGEPNAHVRLKLDTNVGTNLLTVSPSEGITPLEVLNQKGALRVGFLPPGEYFACVRATGGLWLDPCEWDSKRPTVSIQDEQSTADLKVTLKKGTVVEVRVDDPGRLLAQHEGKTKGAGMMVAIASDGLVLRFIPIAATETAGRTHRLIVPYETPLRLIIQGGSFAVSDSFGIPLKDAEATVLPFTVARGKDLPPFGIRIGGIK